MISNSQYRQTSNIKRTKYQNLNVSCLVLQLSLLKSGVRCGYYQCSEWYSYADNILDVLLRTWWQSIWVWGVFVG